MSESNSTNGPANLPSASRRRALNIALWVLQVLLALAFAATGLSKILGQAAMVDMFANIGIGQWFRFVVGVLEVAGAAGLLIPRLCGLAALGLICVMVGAILTNVVILGSSIVLPLIYLILCAVVLWGRWGRTRSLLGNPGS